MRSTSRNRYIQDTKTVFPNLILVRGTLLRFVDIWQHPQDGQIGTKIKEFYYMAASLAPARGTPVGNHCTKIYTDLTMATKGSLNFRT